MHANLPKVLIPEKVSADGLSLLEESLEVHEKKGLDQAQLEQIIGDYDALIVRSETKVNAALLRAGKKLQVVARAGVGVDNVDLEAATKLGIIVINSPQGNINAAAEHTIALLMAVARNVGDACASLKAGKWERSRLVGIEVKGKILAIIGLGKGQSAEVRMEALLTLCSWIDRCKGSRRIGNDTDRVRSIRKCSFGSSGQCPACGLDG